MLRCCSRLRWRRIRWNRLTFRNNCHFLQHHRRHRFVVRIAFYARDRLHHVHARLIALPEDRVVLIQMFRRHLGDEKLAPVCVRAGVRHRQPPGHIEIQIRIELILKRESGIARSRSRRVAALDHELRNHTMKRCAVIQRLVVHLLLRLRIDPVFCPLCQRDKIGHRLRRLLLEKLAGYPSHRRVHNHGRPIGVNQAAAVACGASGNAGSTGFGVSCASAAIVVTASAKVEINKLFLSLMQLRG